MADEKTTEARAKIVARLLTDNGLEVTPPDEGTLDDVERERWKMCIKIVRALDVELRVRRRQIGMLANCLSHIQNGDAVPEPIRIAATAGLVGAMDLTKEIANV